jgi:hypothetical protein
MKRLILLPCIYVVPCFSFSRQYFSLSKGGGNCLTLTKPTRTGQSLGSHHGPAKDMVIVLLGMGDSRETATQWGMKMAGAQLRWAMLAVAKWTVGGVIAMYGITIAMIGTGGKGQWGQDINAMGVDDGSAIAMGNGGDLQWMAGWWPNRDGQW